MTRDASPLALRIARLTGLELDTVTTREADHRIRARDVLAALAGSSSDEDMTTPFADAPPARSQESGHGMVHLESPCDARSLFALALGSGEPSPTVPVEHLFLFLVAHAVARVPGMRRGADVELDPTVRIAYAFGDGPRATLPWNTLNRHLLCFSRALNRAAEDIGSKCGIRMDRNDVHVLVTFSADAGIRSYTFSGARAGIPALDVRYHESSHKADLELTCGQYFPGRAVARAFLSELRQLIEEPRRLLL